ncbi:MULTISPECIES: nucleoside triphosphate pyrophosphohydrolase family protein [unclassified Sporosarcina]|uniref:nucleoside triphosphate pyrophosphohydrolase family protein n=1 Tax=unclassified Sporosarcina TaxID=2647733 RepID=UPI001E2DE670|nr:MULTISPECIES: nucleoside triphosphate pyrophosphohydrolase family protein [unclassified Sporosarcina]
MSKRTLPEFKHSKSSKAANLSNYAMGLSGEAGEVVDLLKKHVYHEHPLDREELAGELGDTLHYLSGLASMNGLTLEEIAIKNIEKLKKRYPNGFSKEDSLNRG